MWKIQYPVGYTYKKKEKKNIKPSFDEDTWYSRNNLPNLVENALFLVVLGKTAELHLLSSCHRT